VELLGKVRDRCVGTPELLQNAASGGVRERGVAGRPKSRPANTIWLRPMFAGQVFFALHFDEAAGGALELKGYAVAVVELHWGGGG
jgi:hypothetical protein